MSGAVKQGSESSRAMWMILIAAGLAFVQGVTMFLVVSDMSRGFEGAQRHIWPAISVLLSVSIVFLMNQHSSLSSKQHHAEALRVFGVIIILLGFEIFLTYSHFIGASQKLATAEITGSYVYKSAQGDYDLAVANTQRYSAYAQDTGVAMEYDNLKAQQQQALDAAVAKGHTRDCRTPSTDSKGGKFITAMNADCGEFFSFDAKIAAIQPQIAGYEAYQKATLAESAALHRLSALPASVAVEDAGIQPGIVNLAHLLGIKSADMYSYMSLAIAMLLQLAMWMLMRSAKRIQAELTQASHISDEPQRIVAEVQAPTKQQIPQSRQPMISNAAGAAKQAPGRRPAVKPVSAMLSDKVNIHGYDAVAQGRDVVKLGESLDVLNSDGDDVTVRFSGFKADHNDSSTLGSVELNYAHKGSDRVALSFNSSFKAEVSQTEMYILLDKGGNLIKV